MFARPLLKAGVTLVGQLRKDAAAPDPADRRRPNAHGRPGRTVRIALSPWPSHSHRHGWEWAQAVSVYGAEVVKQTKTFLATYPPFGGTIRVVIVAEPTGGPQFFYCSDVDAPAGRSSSAS
ncbi:MAG: hypothetical protein R3B90_00615 [Planctomycetaceae bacterium]